MYINSFPPIRQAIRLALLLLFTAVSTLLFSQQQDFNHFQTLTAKGTIPADFIVPPHYKKSNTVVSEFDLFEQYSINKLLHSGNVVFGDDISSYLQKVAGNLLIDDPELQKKLRFYTIKSNIPKAISTNNGIILVSTGLLSQLSKESQLAYILSQQIAHFTEQHIIELPVWRYATRGEEVDIPTLSIYSKKDLLEADSLGFLRCFSAGYNIDEILSTFDVFLYSSLPFEEMEIPRTYLAKEGWGIPENYFSKEEYSIRFNEDVDDPYSNHPYLKSRKAAIIRQIEQLSEQSRTQVISDLNLFKYVRNIARFESVRTYIKEAQFYEALYTIFILERYFSESEYLHQMKALAWLGMAYTTGSPKLTQRIPSNSVLAGESANMYHFYKKLPSEGTLLLATRYIVDISKQHPEDSMIRQTKSYLIKFLAKSPLFELQKYQGLPRNINTESVTKMDSETPTASGSPTKYDKIKQDKITASEQVKNTDSLSFLYTMIADIVTDSVFLSEYNYHLEKNKLRREKSRIERSNKSKKKNKKDPKVNAIDLQHFVLIDSEVYCINNKRFTKNYIQTIPTVLNESLIEVCNKQDVQITLLKRDSLGLMNTDAFNAKNHYQSCVSQLLIWDNHSATPVDYYFLNELENVYGTPNIVSNKVTYDYHSDIEPIIVGMTIAPILAPFTITYIIVKLIRAHNVDTETTIVDVRGQFKDQVDFSFRRKPNKKQFYNCYFPIIERLSKKAY